VAEVLEEDLELVDEPARLRIAFASSPRTLVLPPFLQAASNSCLLLLQSLVHSRKTNCLLLLLLRPHCQYQSTVSSQKVRFP